MEHLPLTVDWPDPSIRPMKTRFCILFASLLGACAAFAETKEAALDPALPNILLIGDSISGGYEKQVKQTLKSKANVIKNEGNAEWTGTGLKKIDGYLGDTRWDIIHFNWGLWDLYGWSYHKEDRSPEAYAKRLDQLVTRMKQTGAKLIFATTTPACPAAEKTMLQKFKMEVIITPEQQAKYSEAALEVMKKHGVEINDLYAYILPTLDKHSGGADNVHFTGSGNGHLAKKVIATLEEALKNLK